MGGKASLTGYQVFKGVSTGLVVPPQTLQLDLRAQQLLLPPSCNHATLRRSSLLRSRLLLVLIPSVRDPLDDVLPILVKLELGDLDLAGRNANRHALAVGLLAAHTLNVDDVFETVDRHDFTLTALVAAALDDDLVVFADGDCANLWYVWSESAGSLDDAHAIIDHSGGRAYVVLLPELCGRCQSGHGRVAKGAHVSGCVVTLRQRCAHDDPAHAGWGLEVSLAALPPAGMQTAIDLGHLGGGGDEEGWVVKGVMLLSRNYFFADGGRMSNSTCQD